MTDLDVFRLSAKACGYSVVDTPIECHIVWHEDGGTEEWNPFTDDSQRWECEKKLLEMGLCVHKNDDDKQHYIAGRNVAGALGAWECYMDCPAAEMPARALAELESRKAS